MQPTIQDPGFKGVGQCPKGWTRVGEVELTINKFEWQNNSKETRTLYYNVFIVNVPPGQETMTYTLQTLQIAGKTRFKRRPYNSLPHEVKRALVSGDLQWTCKCQANAAEAGYKLDFADVQIDHIPVLTPEVTNWMEGTLENAQDDAADYIKKHPGERLIGVWSTGEGGGLVEP